MNSEIKTCQNCKAQFAVEPDDFAFYEKMQVPPPTFCPACRMQRRFMFRNERSIYKRTCDKCGKAFVSMFTPETAHKVYCPPCWWSDSWSPLDQGMDYDPKRPFFEQLKELLAATPLPGLSVAHTTLVNSEYINEAGFCKNCYLVFNSDYCENSLYGTTLSATKDVMDSLILGESELSYELVNCSKCYSSFFSEDLTDCHDVYFSKNLVGCSNCFGCTNLRNKSYHIWNQPYSKEEYAVKIEELKQRMTDAHELAGFIRESEAFWLRSPQKYMHGLQNVNVTGDYVYYSKNSKEIYQSRYVEDSKYVQIAKDKSTKDAYDYSVWGMNTERVYEAITCGENVQNIKFGAVCVLGAHDLEYSLYCYGSAYGFGNVSLRKKEYCILNKQYSKEEFYALRARIVADMQSQPYTDPAGRVWRYGEFFPYDLCPFSYNETIAVEYVPLTKEDALTSGFGWHDAAPSEYTITLEASALPATADATDDILKEIIACSACGKAYRFVKMELDLLKRFGLALPRACSECRHKRRFARLNLPKLWHRNCAKCNKEVQSSYAPERPEIVYCEQCYQQEVV